MDQKWSLVIDELVDDILQQARISEHPVNLLAVCDALGFVVAFDQCQPVRARHKRVAGRHMIFLKPDDRPERLHWAAAHEVGEAFAYRVFEQMNLASHEILEDQREQVANLIASRLLLPKQFFFEDARELKGDLLALKTRYPSASHELIAWRLLDLDEQKVMTIFDQSRLTRRRGNLASPPPKLQQIEISCWEQVHQYNRPMTLHGNGIQVTGWPVHEPDWKREVLCTSPLS